MPLWFTYIDQLMPDIYLILNLITVQAFDDISSEVSHTLMFLTVLQYYIYHFHHLQTWAKTITLNAGRSALRTFLASRGKALSCLSCVVPESDCWHFCKKFVIIFFMFPCLGIGFMAQADPWGTVPSVTYVPLKKTFQNVLTISVKIIARGNDQSSCIIFNNKIVRRITSLIILIMTRLSVESSLLSAYRKNLDSIPPVESLETDKGQWHFLKTPLQCWEVQNRSRRLCGDIDA